MQVLENNNFVRRSGEFDEQDFKIKNSAKAFKILSDSLYSNKVAAIIRELSCNAYDAHVEAGNGDTPFVVHLPEAAYGSRDFRIRDFGTGLSKDDVTTIYSTYFESTKTGSNDFVGCLGLGSKTPFSYTDNFSVVSFFNGVKSVFTAYISENGAPKIALLSEELVTEPNGMEISFAVRASDCAQFLSEAEKIYRWFKVLPTFEGNAIPDIRPLDRETFEHEGFAHGHHMAIMGNVCYPIYTNTIQDSLSEKAASFLTSFRGVIFEFPIGAIEPAPSREALSFTRLTLKAIEKKVAETFKEVEEYVQDIIDKSDGKWEAAINLKADKKYSGYIGKCLRKGLLQKDGETLAHSYDVSDIPCSIPVFSFWQTWQNDAKTRLNEIYRPRSFEADMNTVFIFDDPINKRKYSRGRFRAWMRQFQDDNLNKEFVIFESQNFKDDARKKIIEELGIKEGKHWHYFHDLPEAPKKPRVKSSGSAWNKSEASVLLIRSDITHPAANYWHGKKEKIDLKNGTGYYVPRKGNNILPASGDFCVPSKLSSALASYEDFWGKSFATEVGTVYGLTSTQVDALGPGWVLIWDFLKKDLDKALNCQNFKDLMSIQKSLNAQVSSDWRFMTQLNDASSAINNIKQIGDYDLGPIQSQVAIINQMQEASSKLLGMERYIHKAYYTGASRLASLKEQIIAKEVDLLKNAISEVKSFSIGNEFLFSMLELDGCAGFKENMELYLTAKFGAPAK